MISWRKIRHLYTCNMTLFIIHRYNKGIGVQKKKKTGELSVHVSDHRSPLIHQNIAFIIPVNVFCDSHFKCSSQVCYQSTVGKGWTNCFTLPLCTHCHQDKYTPGPIMAGDVARGYWLQLRPHTGRHRHSFMTSRLHCSCSSRIDSEHPSLHSGTIAGVKNRWCQWVLLYI